MWLSWNATSPFTCNYAWVITRTLNYTDLMDFLILYKRWRESVMFVRIIFLLIPYGSFRETLQETPAKNIHPDW